MDDVSLEDSIEVLLGKVPKPVHDYVLSGLSDQVRRLMDKYQLHIDQGGVLQRELLLMLLGQEEPAEFMRELGKAGISDATIQTLMIDINEEVFKPLRAAEQGRPIERVAPAPVVAAPTPEPAPAPQPQPAPMPEPIQQDMRGVRTMQADMQMIQQQPPWGPQYVAPVYAPPQPYPAYQPVAYMQPQQPQTQTYWVPVTVPVAPQPQMQYVPQPAYQQPVQMPQPVPQAPVVETPAPPPPPPIPEPAPAPEPAAWVPPPPPDWQPPPELPQFEEGREERPIKKEFGADPYREPV